MNLDEAKALDRDDPLAPLREQFSVPPGLVYLDGNSLGMLPLRTRTRVEQVVAREWGESLISAWNEHGWITLPARVGAKIALLVGASAGEVIAGDSTSINLFKTLAASLAMRPGRKVIVTNEGNFPTDVYMIEGLIGLAGGNCELRFVDPLDVSSALLRDVAAVTFSHVDFRSARIEDMAGITRVAHDCGALAVWDLSHSAGAVPVELDRCDADFAVGCGYKYLNGGPGAPAFLYAATRHHEVMKQPLSGWMGHARPFEFRSDYEPGSGIARMLCGTPPVLSMSALDESLGVFEGIDFSLLREKGKRLTTLFVDEVEARCGRDGVELGSPRNPELRGNHVVFRHAEAYAVVQALKAEGVIGDFRKPDWMRFGFAPLYNSYSDAVTAAMRLEDVLSDRKWDRPQFRAFAAVT